MLNAACLFSHAFNDLLFGPVPCSNYTTTNTNFALALALFEKKDSKYGNLTYFLTLYKEGCF